MKQILILPKEDGTSVAHVTMKDGRGFIFPYDGNQKPGTKLTPKQVKILRQYAVIDTAPDTTLEWHDAVNAPDGVQVVLRTVVTDA